MSCGCCCNNACINHQKVSRYVCAVQKIYINHHAVPAEYLPRVGPGCEGCNIYGRADLGARRSPPVSPRSWTWASAGYWVMTWHRGFMTRGRRREKHLPALNQTLSKATVQCSTILEYWDCMNMKSSTFNTFCVDKKECFRLNCWLGKFWLAN